MSAATAILLAVRVGVLGLFSPAHVVVEAPGERHELTLAGGALLVDGRPAPSLRVAAGPGATVAVRLVAPDGSTRITRRFRGTVEALAHGAAIRLVDELPDEEYLPSTVALEAGGGHPEALKVQAVLARTFLARFRKGRRHEDAFDLCDTTHCQTFRGADGETDEARAAVAATRGETVRFRGAPAAVYFTTACGGETADVGDVWPTAARDAPYLRSVACEGCRHDGGHAWQTDVSAAELSRALRLDGASGLAVVARGVGGFVRSARVEAKGGARTLSGEALRIALGRSLGWSRVRSNRFTVEPTAAGGVRLRGRGEGHGVGVCESGAAWLARRGAGYRDILSRYLPDTTVESLDPAAPAATPHPSGAR